MTEAAPERTGFESVSEAVEAQQTSYEYLRDEAPFVPAKARQLLQNADNRRVNIRREYASIDENPDLVSEAKERERDQVYERHQERIADMSQQARDALLSHVKQLTRQALPWPQGESKDISNNTERLSLAYAEADRLVRIVQQRSELAVSGSKKRNPFFSATDFLKGKFAEGIGTAGAQGSALCHGVLRACEEVGVDPEEVLEPLRDDRQRELVDNARRLEMLATSVPTDTPRPRRAGRGRLRGGRQPNLLVGDNGAPTFAGRSNRKPSWK